MQITSIELFELLRPKLGEQEARTLVQYVEIKSEEAYTSKKDVLATKEDVANIKADLIKWMFIFWVGQIGVLIAILNMFFKK